MRLSSCVLLHYLLQDGYCNRACDSQSVATQSAPSSCWTARCPTHQERADTAEVNAQNPCRTINVPALLTGNMMRASCRPRHPDPDPDPALDLRNCRMLQSNQWSCWRQSRCPLATVSASSLSPGVSPGKLIFTSLSAGMAGDVNLFFNDADAGCSTAEIEVRPIVWPVTQHAHVEPKAVLAAGVFDFAQTGKASCLSCISCIAIAGYDR